MGFHSDLEDTTTNLIVDHEAPDLIGAAQQIANQRL